MCPMPLPPQYVCRVCLRAAARVNIVTPRVLSASAISSSPSLVPPFRHLLSACTHLCPGGQLHRLRPVFAVMCSPTSSLLFLLSFVVVSFAPPMTEMLVAEPLYSVHCQFFFAAPSTRFTKSERSTINCPLNHRQRDVNGG